MRPKQVSADPLLVQRREMVDVPQDMAAAFFEGLDDVEHGRTVTVESALAEGRRRLAEWRTSISEHHD